MSAAEDQNDYDERPRLGGENPVVEVQKRGGSLPGADDRQGEFHRNEEPYQHRQA